MATLTKELTRGGTSGGGDDDDDDVSTDVSPPPGSQIKKEQKTIKTHNKDGKVKSGTSLGTCIPFPGDLGELSQDKV